MPGDVFVGDGALQAACCLSSKRFRGALSSLRLSYCSNMSTTWGLHLVAKLFFISFT